ncbi:hypothetical protein PQX77_009119 [Marasmius sp. AFHP31]|nr:hypothetical protein PQX77_009119 [Marasmius sp. AFHP31]
MGSAKKQQAKSYRTRATRSTGKANLLTSDPSRNTELLNNQLRSLGLYAAPTLGDGNCLFRALSDQYYGSPSKHHQVRRDVCDFIEGNPERYEGFVDIDEFGDAGARKGKGGGLKAYVAGMRQNAVYGGHMELSAFAQMTKRNIKVIQPGLVYVIQYDPPQPTTPKKAATRDKKTTETLSKTPSKSNASAADDSPPRRTRSITKSEAALNDREKRHRRRELQRQKEEEEAKRQQDYTADSEETEEEGDDDSQMAVDEPQTSGPTIYVAYHDWEHFSSIRSLRGPHTGIPNVEETPAATSYNSSSSSHDSNSPFSQASSRTSRSSPPDEQEEDLSPAKARKREREKKEREKKERKAAQAKEKASSKPKSSSKAPPSMDRFLKGDGVDEAESQSKSKISRGKSPQKVQVKPEPVDDVLPPADSVAPSTASSKTGFKLRIPPMKALASSKAPSEIIDVDSYATPSPLTSESDSEEEPASVNVVDEDVAMSSPTKPTSTSIGREPVAALSVATSPPTSHSPSPAPPLSAVGILTSPTGTASRGTPTGSGNPYLNANMTISHPNLPHSQGHLNMSNPNTSLPNLANVPHQQAQAQAYMAAMYSYAAAAAAAGYPPYSPTLYGYPSPTGSGGSGSGPVPSHLAHQFPYGYPTGYGYPYGYAYPSTSSSTSTQPPSQGSRAATSFSTSSNTPNATTPPAPNPNPNPYMHMQGSYPFPFTQQHYNSAAHSQQPQPPPQPSSGSQSTFPPSPPNHLSHLTHLTGQEQRSPKRSFEESCSDDVSDIEKEKTVGLGDGRSHSRSLSKDLVQDPALAGTASSPGSGSESDYKRSRLDRAGKRSNSRRSASNEDQDPRLVDISTHPGESSNEDLAASNITIKAPVAPMSDPDADADGDPDPEYVADEAGDHDTEEEEEKEVARKLSSGSVSTSPEDEDEDEDDTLQPNLNHTRPLPSSSKSKGGGPDRPLTRRERKKLGLPKARPGATTSTNRIVIPGGKYAQTGPSDEWLSNGAGRVDVRGFRELKI